MHLNANHNSRDESSADWVAVRRFVMEVVDGCHMEKIHGSCERNIGSTDILLH